MGTEPHSLHWLFLPLLLLLPPARGGLSVQGVVYPGEGGSLSRGVSVRETSHVR